MRHRRPLVLAAAMTALLNGCAVGPDYLRPDLQLPTAWRFSGTPETPQAEPQELANLPWWTLYEEPVLDELVREALTSNRDLRIAAARVDEAAGQLGSTRSQLFPQLGASLGDNRGRTSTSGGRVAQEYSAAFNVSWEIDLFGRLRRSSEAARANLLASEEARRGLVISLAATVANSYVNLRDLDNQLEIARSTVKTREDALRIFELRYKGGVISEMELSQARSQLEAARVTVPALEQAIAQQEHNLSALLGRLPGPIPRGKPLAQLGLPLPPVSLPSRVLERRPDIRQAEQNLIAANAGIGAARAAYFPTISLTGLLGSVSSAYSGLFTGPARAWSFGSNATAPLFTAGGLAGQLQSAEARQVQALESYRKAVEAAFRDVEDSLIAGSKTREVVDGYIRQVDALAIYARNARLRYESGYSDYLEVLDAERSLFQAQISASQAHAQALTAVATLYKALGGGWQATEDAATNTTE